MTAIIIWDPFERFLWGIALSILFFGGIQYLRMSKYNKNQKERILLCGFAILFFSIVAYRIFAIIYEIITPGVYTQYGFYGDYDQINPILREIILKCAYISSLTGFMLFSYTFEKYLKKTKYSITFLHLLLIIAIILLPLNAAIFLENYIITVIEISLLIFFLFYISKYSQIEFKSITFLLLLGLLLIFIGFTLTDDDIQKYHIIPLFVGPLLVIIGGIIAISPTIINPKYFYQSLNYWKIIAIIIFGGFFTILIICLYLQVIIFTTMGLIIIMLIFSYLFYNHFKHVKSEFHFKNVDTNKNGSPNILGMFAKPEKIFRLIAENANDLIEIFDENFQIEYINENIHNNLLGYSKEDLMGQNRMEFIHPDDGKEMLRKQKEFIINKEIIGEIRFKRKDGTYIWLEYRGKAYKGINYEMKYLLISRDVTQHKEYIKKLQEVDDLRKDFIIRATHDLKNPITSIYTVSKMIYDIIEEMPEHHKKILPEKFLQLYDYIYNDGIRLKKLAHNLLDFSRLESGTFQLNKERINITEIINECIKAEEFLSNKRKITISNDLPESLNIKADKIRLSQIFQNLISNALKNTPINGKINISSIKNENYIKILVKDTGIGLNSEEIKKLFSKFCKIERKETNLESEGFGCGLYITKQIVLSHRGKIWADSPGRNKGTTFIVELPINMNSI